MSGNGAGGLLRALVARLRADAPGATASAGGWMLGSAVVESVSLALLVPILRLLIDGPGATRFAARLAALGIADRRAPLLLVLAVFLGIGLLRSQVTHRRDAATARLQAAFSGSERHRLFATLARARWSDIGRLSHARVGAIVTAEVDRATGAVQHLLRAAVLVLTLAAQLAVALVVSPALTGLALLLFAGMAAQTWRGKAGSLALGGEAARNARALYAGSSGYMAGLKTALAENTQGLFLAGLGRVLEHARETAERQQKRLSDTRLRFGRLSTLFAAGLVAAGVVLDVAPARLIAAVIVLSRMAGPAQQVQQALQLALMALPSFGEIMALHEHLPPLAEPPQRAPRRSGTLAFHAVRFAHGTAAEGAEGGMLGPYDLVLAPGARVGITGPSGAGKTTLLDLAVGLLRPSSGVILLDGAALDGAVLAGWREGVAYLGQAVFQVNDSVRANLALSGATGPDGVPLDDAALWAALALAGADGVVAALPQGLDSALGETGATISGGERQRIALARALLRRPHLLVLDEALAAVDIATEQAILARLAAVDWPMAMLVVAHRPESLAGCDSVIEVR